MVQVSKRRWFMKLLRFPQRSTPSESAGPAGPQSYEVQYRTVHGHKRAFVLAGRGPALLLIHGIGDCSDTFRELIPELARDHTVIAPDLLGHGRSDKPRADYSVAAYANAMRDLLSVLDIDRVTVVGHSLGGGVAMQFAYQYPDRCERVVLIGTGGVSQEVHPILRMISAPNADLVLPILQVPGSRAVGRAVFGLQRWLNTDLGRDADHLLRVFDALPDATSRRAFVRTLRSVVDWRGQAITMLDRCYLAHGMPTLLVWGGRDAIIPVHHGRIAHAAMPGSRLEVFDDAGHFPHQTHASQFVGVLRDFLASTSPAAYDKWRWRDALRHGASGERTLMPGSVRVTA
jgi:pimeloyl-ACP methyl ester carboxylesterase